LVQVRGTLTSQPLQSHYHFLPQFQFHRFILYLDIYKYH
jgi:hypothetical protein